jgi:hypothetical protein
MAMGNKTTNLIWIDYTISSTMYRAYAQICSFDLPHLRSEKIKLIKLQQAYSLRPSPSTVLQQAIFRENMKCIKYM